VALLVALGGVGDEAGALVVVATGKPPRTNAIEGESAGGVGLDGAVGGAVGEGDGAVIIDLAEVPETAFTVGEVILETVIVYPAAVVGVVLDFLPGEGALEGVGAVIVIDGALGMEGELQRCCSKEDEEVSLYEKEVTHHWEMFHFILR